MGLAREGEGVAVEVIGCFETGQSLARSWRSRFRTHCRFAVDSDVGLATLVLGVKKRQGVGRLRNSCFGISMFDA